MTMPGVGRGRGWCWASFQEGRGRPDRYQTVPFQKRQSGWVWESRRGVSVGFLLLLFFQPLAWVTLAKESRRGLVDRASFRDSSGIEAWLCDLADLRDLSEARVHHM